MMWSIVLLVSVLYGGFAAPVENEVLALPGWNKPLPSKQYSGFVNASGDGMMQMHYWFVESEVDPASAPLVLWFNGGPGASSLYGLLLELGPFRLSDLSINNAIYEATGIPQLVYNPNGWQRVANILALSMPPPVGFSYCTPPGPSAQGNDCGPWDDASTALATYTALLHWLSLFPEYASHDLYLTGESYAGVYVPLLAQQILAHPENGIKLTGIAVGDACTPPDVCGGKHLGPFYYIEFLYGKSAFSTRLYNRIHATCTEYELRTGNNITSECQAIIDEIPAEVGGYWMYAYYDDCWYENDIRRHLQARSSSDWMYYGPPLHRPNSIPNGYVCGGPNAMNIYLSLDVVKQALHVPTEAVFFQCDNGADFTYDTTQPDLVSWYRDIITSNTLRVLVYNGDTDPCISAYQAETWTASLGFPVLQPWRPWTLDNCQRMGGAVTRYANNFDFLTIRGSGHMVPQFKPEASLEFISRFLKNEDYKVYDASCTAPAKMDEKHKQLQLQADLDQAVLKQQHLEMLVED